LDIRTLELLRATSQYFSERQREAYLVGGSVRDILLGEACVDWDIVTDGDASRLARGLADRLGGHYAHLHDKASRVVVKGEEQEIVFDVAPFKGSSLEEDLRLRDFTVNAMAAPLDETVQWFEMGDDGRSLPGLPHTERGRSGQGQASPVHLIDPLHGAEDVKARCLRAVDDGVFQDDPLRLLRAVRLRMRYGLHVDEWTEGLMMRDAALLARAAAQRVHDELYAILKPDGASERLRYIDELGLLTVLMPEFVAARGMRQPGPHFWDVLEHSVESVAALERLARMLQEGRDDAGDYEVERQVSIVLASIRELLQEAQEQGVFRFGDLTAPRMKLAALLHDVGKPVTYKVDKDGGVHFYHHQQAGVPLAQQVMKRLGASTQDRRLVELVTAHHMRPGQLAQADVVTPRAIRRFFVDLGPAGIAVALFSLADHLATLGPQPLTDAWEQHVALVHLLLVRYIRERESILPPRLVSAEELMRRLKLERGPQVGQLLDQIAEAQAEGIVRSKEEALWWAEEWLSERTR
jgi:poly(A) polymerase